MFVVRLDDARQRAGRFVTAFSNGAAEDDDFARVFGGSQSWTRAGSATDKAVSACGSTDRQQASLSEQYRRQS